MCVMMKTCIMTSHVHHSERGSVIYYSPVDYVMCSNYLIWTHLKILRPPHSLSYYKWCQLNCSIHSSVDVFIPTSIQHPQNHSTTLWLLYKGHPTHIRMIFPSLYTLMSIDSILVLSYTAVSTEASWRAWNFTSFITAVRVFEPGLEAPSIESLALQHRDIDYDCATERCPVFDTSKMNINLTWCW